MSQSYENFIGAQASRIIPTSGDVLEKNDNSKGYIPRCSCVWSSGLSDSLLMFFTQIDYPFRHCYEIPFAEPLRSEIRRFLISLDAYIESPNPVIPYKDILYGSTKLDYADTLKRIKRKSFETTWNVSHFAYPDWWDSIPAYHIRDIGDIFNYSYLIFWQQPEPDDYKHGFEEVNIDDSILEDFKVILACILPDEDSFNIVDETEVLGTISSSMSYNDKNKTHSPHYKLKPQNLYFNSQIGEVDRVILNVSPANTRDSVLVTPSALNTISLIDKQVMEILSKMSMHIHIRDKDKATRRLQNLYKNYTLFLQRDIRKEGITKPRELLKAMLEVLHDAYPKIRIFENVAFYDDYCLRIDSETTYPDRGHGLGMANALTTLMQLVIHNMVMDHMADIYPECKSKCIALNDDFVAGFEEYCHVDEYWDYEDEIMEGLSIIRAPEKSFLSERRFVIAERYFDGEEHKKVSYQIREALMPLSCYNIVHAKDYFRSVQTYVSSHICSKYIEEVVSHWGYEFYKDEFQYPYITGGWRNEIINSVDLSLLELDENEFSAKVVRGAYAALATPYRKKYKGNNYCSPYITLYGHPYIPEEYKNHFDSIPTDQLDDKYGRILSRSESEFRHYWDSLAKNRKKAFDTHHSISYTDLLKMLIKSYPASLFYPAQCMIESYAAANIGTRFIKDIYMDPNPRLALISKYNSVSYQFKEEFSIQFTRADEFSKKSQSLFPKDIERSLKTQILAPLLTGKENEYLYPADEDIHPERLYLNPVKIGIAASVLDWGKGYPIIREEYKSPILDYKQEVFNRLFTITEQAMLTEYEVRRSAIKGIADYMNRNPDETLSEIIEKLVQMLEDDEDNLIHEYSESDSEECSGVKNITSYSDTYRFNQDNKRIVDIEDLLTDVSLIWSIISNPDGYVYSEVNTEMAVNEIVAMSRLCSLTGRGVFDTRGNFERLRSNYGIKVRVIVERLNLESLIYQQAEGESESDDDIDYGQLWDDDG